MKGFFVSYNSADPIWAEDRGIAEGTEGAEGAEPPRAGGLCPYRPGLSSKARNPP